MVKRDARQEISDWCRDKVRERSLAKVRIADLIDKLGINRNTFYYHFANKYEVMQWIFRTDLARALRSAFPDRELVFEEDTNESEKKRTVGLPYYVHVEIGARTLDTSLFCKTVVETACNDREFYRKIINVQEPEFILYLKRLWTPAIARDIDFILGGRYMPEPTREMLAHTGAGIIISAIEYNLEHPDQHDALMRDDMNPFWNELSDSLHVMIANHPLNPSSRSNLGTYR